MKKLVITKYDNRKLYSTEFSKYLNFKQMKELYEEGYRFTVIEKSTEKDVTFPTMLELLKKHPEILGESLTEKLLGRPSIS